MRLALLPALLLVSAFSHGQVAMMGPFNPRTYRSKSGDFSLYVDPTEPTGAKASICSLKRRGKLLWRKRLPLTPWNAVLTNTGSVCAYTGDQSKYHLLVFSPSGEQLVDKGIPYTPSYATDSPPGPRLVGMTASSEADLFEALFMNSGQERQGEPSLQLEEFRASTGEAVKTPLAAFVNSNKEKWPRDISFVPGTTCLLSMWTDSDPRNTYFRLVDLAGNMIWSWDKRFTRFESYEHYTSRSISTSERSFVVGFDQLQIHYRLRFAGGGPSPRVEFVGTLHPVATKPHPTKFPSRRLLALSEFPIAQPNSKPKPAVRDVNHFSLAGPHRLAFVGVGQNRITVISDRGKVLQRIALPANPEGYWEKICYLNPTSFALVRTIGNPSVAEVWRLDLHPRSLHLLLSFPRSVLNSVSRGDNGSLIVCADISKPYTMVSVIDKIDLHGKRIWRLGGQDGYSGAPSEVAGSEGATAFPNGSIGVLDNIAPAVRFFGKDGRFQRMVSLAKSTGGKMIYPTKLVAESDGSFLIYDEDLYHFDRNGKLMGKIAASEGRDFAWTKDGIWMSDGHNLTLLSGKNGAVLRTLGEPLQPTKLRKISDLRISTDGYIFAEDERSNSVHIFSEGGKWRRVVKTQAEKYGFGITLDMGSPRSIVFDQVSRYLRATDGLGRVTRKPKNFSLSDTHLRRSDGCWLEGADSHVFAADGSWATLDEPMRGELTAPSYVCFYDRRGKPTTQFALPVNVGRTLDLAYDGGRVLVSTESSIYCFNKSGKPLWRAAVANLNRVFLVKGLICAWTGENTIRRFKMPKD